MNNKPVVWRKVVGNVTKHYQYNEMGEGTPLYTHPSEHDLGIAEAIGFEKGHKSAEDMLRQQQAEIEALKAGKIRAYDNGVEDGRKPNTHPVKELTDEEIIKVYEDMLGVASAKGSAIDFARAILLKAQENERK